MPPCAWPPPCWKNLWPTGATGRSPAFAPRSRRARACASAVRNCPRPCEKKFRWRRPRHTLKGRQTESDMKRVGLRLQLRKQQAEAGDIILLLRRRERGVDASLSRPRMGKGGGGPACAG